MTNISIDSSTGIRLGLLVVLAPAIFWGITTWTRVQSQTEQNTSDISTLVSKLDTLNDNLNKTNGNIIELNTKLDSLTSRNNTTAQTNTEDPINVTYLQPTSEVQPTSSEAQEATIQQPPSETPQDTSPQPSPIESLVAAVVGLLRTN